MLITTPKQRNYLVCLPVWRAENRYTTPAKKKAKANGHKKVSKPRI